MAEGDTNVQSTHQQDGAGEAKTDAQNAADQKGAQGGGEAGAGDAGGRTDGQPSGAAAGGDGKPGSKAGADADNAAGKGDGGDKKVAPEKYDLKLSDGSLLEPKFVDKIAAIAREQGLSNEDAQAHLAEIEKQAMLERNAQVNEWNEAVKADKELGGANYEKTLKSVQRYAGHLKEHYPELHDLLERSGRASDPVIAKYLRDMGDRMAEDTNQPSGGKGKAKKAPLEERLYPSTPKQAA